MGCAEKQYEGAGQGTVYNRYGTGDLEQEDKKMETYFVWKNDFGSLSIDSSEHGHYASDCIYSGTYEECMEFCSNYAED